jgi:hypothetical protein
MVIQDLLVKSPDVTRSIVQKAVVVLARQPIFGPIRQKLAVITAAWFNEKDFTKLDILHVRTPVQMMAFLVICLVWFILNDCGRLELL